MRISTFNVNGINARLPTLLRWLGSARRLAAAGVDRHVRGWEKASDHAPAWIELAERSE